VADIYLDSCCFIYLVEGEREWRTVVERRLRDLEPTSRLVTSQLARLECRAKPTRDGNRALLARYDMLFGADRVAVVDVSADVIDRATAVRARHGSRRQTQFIWRRRLNLGPPSSGWRMLLCRAALRLPSRCL
jgi:hypothetical protein